MSLDIVRDNPHPYPSVDYDLFLKELVEDNIKLWKKQYYEGEASVDDGVYDLWWKNLLALEAKHGVSENSPSINPGYELV